MQVLPQSVLPWGVTTVQKEQLSLQLISDINYLSISLTALKQHCYCSLTWTVDQSFGPQCWTCIQSNIAICARRPLIQNRIRKWRHSTHQYKPRQPGSITLCFVESWFSYFLFWLSATFFFLSRPSPVLCQFVSESKPDCYKTFFSSLKLILSIFSILFVLVLYFFFVFVCVLSAMSYVFMRDSERLVHVRQKVFFFDPASLPSSLLCWKQFSMWTRMKCARSYSRKRMWTRR